MKVRIKFSKEGPMKFVGHLDTMRYFQKALRRAELPVAFSGGYSPHMIMSFAVPLGVGMERHDHMRAVSTGKRYREIQPAYDHVFCGSTWSGDGESRRLF